MRRRAFIGIIAGVAGALGLGRFMPTPHEQMAAGLMPGLTAPSRKWFRLYTGPSRNPTYLGVTSKPTTIEELRLYFREHHARRAYANPRTIAAAREQWEQHRRAIEDCIVPTRRIS